MTDIPAIARGLTKAQRELAGGFLTAPLPPRTFAQIRGALRRKGIFADIGLTDLGKQVRHYLENQSHD